MNDILKWVSKVVLQAVLWVFILSITWDGKPMFFYAHNTLVKNAFVEAVDEQMAELWYKLSTTAKVTFNEPVEAEEQKL